MIGKLLCWVYDHGLVVIPTLIVDVLVALVMLACGAPGWLVLSVCGGISGCGGLLLLLLNGKRPS